MYLKNKTRQTPPPLPAPVPLHPAAGGAGPRPAPRGRLSAGRARLPRRPPGSHLSSSSTVRRGCSAEATTGEVAEVLFFRIPLMGRCEAVEAAIAGRSGCWLRVAAGVGSRRRRGGRCRDPPGGRGAQAGLKQPHLLSPIPASPSRHNDRNATADAARRAALCRRQSSPLPAEAAGLMPRRGSDADAEAKPARLLAISRAGRGEN